MNYFETDIQNLTRKIKKIDDNPDPTKLKSNRMRYELMLEMRKAQLQAWKDGKPFASGIRYLSQAMGYVPGAGLSGAAIGIVTGGSSQYGSVQKYFEACRERGLPVEAACDMSMLPCGATEIKDVPDAPFDVCDTATCTTMWLAGIYYMLQTETPLVYYLDTGYRQDEADFRHVVNQLDEFIELSEKIPGIKYDEDKLIEIQTHFETVQGYYREIYQMMKNKPSPISGKDTLTFNLNGFNSYPESAMPKWVEYAKLRRDEVGERLAKGQFAVPDEKARVIWTVTNPQYMDVQRVLFKHKIAMILQYGGLTHNLVPLPLPDYMVGKTLTPLEKVAYGKASSLWAGTSSRWIDNLIWTCRDLGADGIVYYNMLGCGATLGLRKMVEEKAEAELGIPTLQLEGKQWDTDYASPETISGKLDEFAQLVLSRKGIA
ncbi:2-hydroxyacyl-CoA dehydratase [Thermodesulfobacteriota bacterium]